MADVLPTASARRTRPTIRDVAAAAQVSVATVSYVLNNTPGQTIRESTRERVREAAARLGYLPHGVARTLREGTARIVLLNTGDVAIGASLASFIRGMGDELRSLGHTLVVTSAADAARADVPRDLIEAVSPRAVLDLATLTSGVENDDTVSGTVEGAHVGFAFQNRQQLRFLKERGHRHIAFVTPQGGEMLPRIRRAQAVSAAADLGIGLQTLDLDLDGDPEGRQRAVEHLAHRSEVTAVAAYDDDVAVAVLSAMADAGLRAPRDLAVIGFDESPMARLWRPALTTFRIDADGYGRRAARVALGLDPGEWRHAPSQVVIRETA